MGDIGEDYPRAIVNKEMCRMDNCTDALILNQAYSSHIMSPIQSVLLVPSAGGGNPWRIGFRQRRHRLCPTGTDLCQILARKHVPDAVSPVRHREICQHTASLLLHYIITTVISAFSFMEARLVQPVRSTDAELNTAERICIAVLHSILPGLNACNRRRHFGNNISKSSAKTPNHTLYTRFPHGLFRPADGATPNLGHTLVDILFMQ